MIRAAIIDDDKSFCEELKEQILKLYSQFEVCCYNNIEDFAADAAEYNIAIVDIILDEGNGIDLSETISLEFPLLNIIFVSAERDFFQDVYKVTHSYFMVKPISDNELDRALKMCCKNLNERSLYLKHRSGIETIELNTVVYFEGILKKTMIHYADATKKLVNTPLREIEKKLCNSNFVRTHQSYIVNIQYVLYASRRSLSTRSADIPVSRKYSSSITEAMGKYLIGDIPADNDEQPVKRAPKNIELSWE